MLNENNISLIKYNSLGAQIYYSVFVQNIVCCNILIYTEYFVFFLWNWLSSISI